jgi:hypothetical protein
LVAKQMRPKDAIRPFLDYHLVARIFLRDPEAAPESSTDNLQHRS